MKNALESQDNAEGARAAVISMEFNTNMTKVYLVINKALTFGIRGALTDSLGMGKRRSMSDESKSCIIGIA